MAPARHLQRIADREVQGGGHPAHHRGRDGVHGDPRVRALQVVPGLRLRGELPELGVLHGGAVRHRDRDLRGIVAVPAPAGAEPEDGLRRDTGGVAGENGGAPRELAARRSRPSGGGGWSSTKHSSGSRHDD